MGAAGNSRASLTLFGGLAQDNKQDNKGQDLTHPGMRRMLERLVIPVWLLEAHTCMHFVHFVRHDDLSHLLGVVGRPTEYANRESALDETSQELPAAQKHPRRLSL